MDNNIEIQEQLLPDHDITFDDIMICPIDDHQTMGINVSISDILSALSSSK